MKSRWAWVVVVVGCHSADTGTDSVVTTAVRHALQQSDADAGAGAGAGAGADAGADAGAGAGADADAGAGAGAVPPLPSASLDAATDAGAPRPRPTGKRLGARCSLGTRGECAAGLVCCETGFTGQCGGAYTAEPREPCVFISTCTTAPCRPVSTPP
jgi:hypothetical protein